MNSAMRRIRLEPYFSATRVQIALDSGAITPTTIRNVPMLALSTPTFFSACAVKNASPIVLAA